MRLKLNSINIKYEKKNIKWYIIKQIIKIILFIS